MNALELFPGPLADIYATFSQRMLTFGDDIDERFTKTQVAYRVKRQFAWLSPITKTKALITLDLWTEHTAPQLTNVIRFRDDKATHQVDVCAADDVHAVIDLGWFEEAVAWGRKQQHG